MMISSRFLRLLLIAGFWADAAVGVAQEPVSLPDEFALDPVWIESPPAVEGLPAAIHFWRQAQNEMRVLHVGAHPDDEHSGLVAWLARTKGYRVAYLSGTRGEGGQNSLGPERGPALAILRTEELLAARRIDGGEQRFLNLPDFGFSKTSDETLQQWWWWEPEQRLVQHIREFRPQYIVSCFLGDPVDGHGHHQAMGLLCREAFRKAGDPNYLPETEPWQADALLASRWRLDDAADLTIDLGVHDPVYGLSPYQIAARGRSMHKSQDMGMLQPFGGGQFVQLRLLDLAEGVAKEDVLAAFEPVIPKAELPNREALLELWNQYAQDPEKHRDGLWRVQRALHELDGPHFELVADRLEAIEDESVQYTARVVALDDAVILDALQVEAIADYAISSIDFQTQVLQPGESVEFSFSGQGKRYRFTQPQYLDEGEEGSPRDEALLRWRADFGPEAEAAEIYPPLIARLSYRFVEKESPSLSLGAYPAHVWRDPIRGERREWLYFRPEILGEANPTLQIQKITWNGVNENGFWLVEYSERKPIKIYIDYKYEKIFYDFNEFYHNPAEAEGFYSDNMVLPKPKLIHNQFYKKKVDMIFNYIFTLAIPSECHYNSSLFNWFFQKIPYELKIMRKKININYEHIGQKNIYSLIKYRFVQMSNYNVPENLKIAYIQGAGDDIPSVLRSIGIEVTEIPPSDLAQIDWNQFDTVVLGVRAYELVPELVETNERLMDWVRAGGTVVVQYNQYKLQDLGVAPYPFAFHRPHDRITDEEAEVTILEPDSPILNYPNEISSGDFAYWVQERSLYGFGEFDESQYKPILSAADPGEEPQRGMLLEARVGKGRWIYSALALFRQVPEGVPGGVRLMINLAAQGRWTKEHQTASTTASEPTEATAP